MSKVRHIFVPSTWLAPSLESRIGVKVTLSPGLSQSLTRLRDLLIQIQTIDERCENNGQHIAYNKRTHTPTIMIRQQRSQHSTQKAQPAFVIVFSGKTPSHGCRQQRKDTTTTILQNVPIVLFCKKKGKHLSSCISFCMDDIIVVITSSNNSGISQQKEAQKQHVKAVAGSPSIAIVACVSTKGRGSSVSFLTRKQQLLFSCSPVKPPKLLSPMKIDFFFCIQ